MTVELNDVIERVVKGEYASDELVELLEKLSCSGDRCVEVVDLVEVFAEQVEDFCQGGNTGFAFSTLSDLEARREELRTLLTLEFGSGDWL